ncbi:unnamed protein product [Parajaminaea phylloscopi]
MTKTPCTPSRGRAQSAIASPPKTPTPTAVRATRSVVAATNSRPAPASADSSPTGSSPPRPPNAWILYRSYKLDQLKQAETQGASSEDTAGVTANRSKKKRSGSPVKGALTASALAALATVSNDSWKAQQDSRPATPSLVSEITDSTLATGSSLCATSSQGGSRASSHLGGPKKHTPISSLLAQMWKHEPEDVKASFHQLAKSKEQEHRKMWPDYKYRPKDTEKSRAARERRRRGINGEPSSSLIDPDRLPRSTSPRLKERHVGERCRTGSPARAAARPYPASLGNLRTERPAIAAGRLGPLEDSAVDGSQRNMSARTRGPLTAEQSVSDSSMVSSATIIEHDTAAPSPAKSASQEPLLSSGSANFGEQACFFQSSPETTYSALTHSTPLTVSSQQGDVFFRGWDTFAAGEDVTMRQLIASPRAFDMDTMEWLTRDALAESGPPLMGVAESTFDILSSVWPAEDRADSPPAGILEPTGSSSKVEATQSRSQLSKTHHRADSAASCQDISMTSELLSSEILVSQDGEEAKSPDRSGEAELLEYLSRQSSSLLCDSPVEELLADPRDRNVLPSEVKGKRRTPSPVIAPAALLTRNPYRAGRPLSSSVVNDAQSRFPRPRAGRFPLPNCARPSASRHGEPARAREWHQRTMNQFATTSTVVEASSISSVERDGSLTLRNQFTTTSTVVAASGVASVDGRGSPTLRRSLWKQPAAAEAEAYPSCQPRDADMNGSAPPLLRLPPSMPEPHPSAAVREASSESAGNAPPSSQGRVFKLQGTYSEHDLWTLLLSPYDSPLHSADSLL